MRASSRKLAHALAARLNQILPVPFRITAHDELLHVYVGDQLDSISSTLEIVEDESRELTERLETAVHSVIDRLQDQVSVYLHTPWPSLDGHTMAMAEVDRDEDSIHLWFGDKLAPVLTIPAISISEIMDPDRGSSSGARVRRDL
jgi:hypothetical protein